MRSRRRATAPLGQRPRVDKIFARAPIEQRDDDGGRPGGELGRLLRHWRKVRGKSQIDLSLDTGVSQRHLSCIESGRSGPGRGTLLNLARALDVPLRDRNDLLLAAGYAPAYEEKAWNANEMRSVTRALERLLRQHEPFPALVLDRYWNVVTRNAAALRFFNAFIDLDARPVPRNMLHLMFDPAGMRPFVANWEQAAEALIQRVRHEAVGHTLDARTRDLLAELRVYPSASALPRSGEAAASAAHAAHAAQPMLPMISLDFRKDGQLLRYFSMVTTVGTPRSIAAQELRIESMFPADATTEAAHLALMEARA